MTDTPSLHDALVEATADDAERLGGYDETAARWLAAQFIADRKEKTDAGE